MTTPPTSKGRLLLLCQLFYPETISTGMHMTELALGLTRQGWKIDVVCAQPSVHHEGVNQKVPNRIEYEGVTIHRVPSIGSHRGSIASRLLFALSFVCFTAWWTLLRAGHFRGIIVTTNPPFLGLVGCLAKWLRRIPYILIVYDVYPDTVVRLGLLGPRSPVTWLWERTSRIILHGAAANVVIGRDMAKVVTSKLNKHRRGRLALIPNWSDEHTVHPIPKARNTFRAEQAYGQAFIVQYSGTMARIHNLEPLIEAAAALKSQRVLFQFIGDGAKKAKLRKIATEKGLENIVFLPYQPLERLAEVLSAADLAVVSLAPEFTGLSVPSKAYGVMAAGVPILAFMDPESEIGLTISEAECGVVLPDPSGKQVADLIRTLTNDPARLEQMGRNGLHAFKARYTLARIANEYDQLLSRVLACQTA